MAEKKVEEKKQNAVVANKATMVVALRNKFFFVLYRYSSLVFLTSIIAFCTALFFLIFFSRQPVSPQYIAVNEDATYFNLEPLSECKPQVAVQKFVIVALKKIYKYDYVNYTDQLQEASSYFTTQGWNTFLTQYTKSDTLLAVKDNKAISTIDISQVPEITQEGQINGVCAWEGSAKATVKYLGKKDSEIAIKVLFRVVRNSVINNPEGLGVETLVVQVQNQ